MNKIIVKVDMVKYCEVFGFIYHESRRLDYTYDYEEMSLTPQEIKDFIDKGISIKLEQ